MPLGLLRFEMLLPVFALVLARIAGLAFAVPVFAGSLIPRNILALLIAALSLMIFPVVLPLLPTSLSLGQALAGVVGEFLIGELLGLGVGLIFYAAQFAGQIVSHQAGLSLGTVFNPMFDEESNILDQVWFFSVMVLFFAFRGHIAVVEVLLASFKSIPPLTLVADPAIGDFAVNMLNGVVNIATRLAGPTVLALLLTSLILGFLTRTMPQMNILTVGFAFKVGVALLMVAVTMGSSEGLVGDALFDGLDQVGRLFEQLSQQVTRGA
jgi:flagellar biosynthesis protein FliR